jgi:hypothetical protein
MKLLPIALSALLLAASPALGSDEKPKEETARPKTMAERAAAARANRKKSTAKVITNADVRKSGGKLIENSGALAPVEPAPTATLSEKHAADRQERARSDARLDAARKVVADLERELLAIEQSYYEESDLERRDGEIARRFNSVSAALTAARAELALLLPEPPSQ